jgi:hypothetical protein
MAQFLVIKLARLEGKRSRRKDSRTTLQIRLVSYCQLLPVRLKLDDMDPKCYSAASGYNIRFSLYDHLCNSFYLLFIAGTGYQLCYVYYNNDSGIVVEYIIDTSNLL